MLTVAAPCTIKAGASEGDSGHPGPSTFEAVAYDGTPVDGSTATPRLDSPYVLELSGMTQGRSPKVNLDHKSAQRVGHLTSFANDGTQVRVAGALSAATPYRDEVANSAAHGYGWEVSIEASMSKIRKLAAGKTAVVNGRTVTGPLYIVGKSVLTDIGFVSHGANEGNQVTIAASAAGANRMSKFDEFVVSCGVDPEAITDDHRARLQKLFDLEQAGGEPVARKSFKDVAEEERRESARKDQITKMMKDAMREHPLYINQIEELAGQAIDDPTTDADKFELHLTRSLRTVKGSFTASMHRSENDPKVIEAAMCMAAGLPNVEKQFSPETLDAVDRAGLHRGFSLQSMLMQVANRNGYSCRAGERIHPGNIRSVLEHCFPPATARLAGFSAVSLPNVLGAVANKAILAGYMEEDTTWREIAQVRPVSNFHTQNHYRMLDSLEYEEVGSGGEIKHGTLGEETFTSQAKTYGKMLGITRTQIINDDLGAFDDIRARLGRGAASKFGDVFWTAFINNSSFYTTALTNYIEGSTTNLGTDGVGLGLMVKAFRTMTTPTADGSKRIGIGLNPSKILVPPEIEANAMLAFRANNLDNVALSSGNIYANRFKPVVQWRLSNSSFTGYSTTAWYMFGDSIKPMLVTFLNGQEAPTVESTDADFNVLGIQFRAYHDFGCDKSEYLAGVKSKGAA